MMRTDLFGHHEGQNHVQRYYPELWEAYQRHRTESELSNYERKLIQNWIANGHDIYDTIESGYLRGTGCPPAALVDACRFDHGVSKDIERMTKAKKERYLTDTTEWEEPDSEYLTMEKCREHTPKIIKDRVRRLERDLFHLWNFVWQEGLGDEAKEYVVERKDEEIPFEW